MDKIIETIKSSSIATLMDWIQKTQELSNRKMNEDEQLSQSISKILEWKMYLMKYYKEI